uniref:SHSP domain-containing protein n=1 Tax=Panagrellus redivivus TaxID=6233 RepID=A0A7E4VTX7_PANRE
MLPPVPMLPLAPFWGPGFGPLAWHHAMMQQHPAFAAPMAMLRQAETQMWEEHVEHINETTPALGPDGEFSYQCNAIGYKPEQLGIDIHDNEIVIQAQNNSNGQHVFYRRFTLPPQVEPESLKCDMDENGMLTIGGRIDPNTRGIEYNRENTSSSSGGRRTPIPIGVYKSRPAISY